MVISDNEKCLGTVRPAAVDLIISVTFCPFGKSRSLAEIKRIFFSKDFFKRIFFGMKISKVRLFVIQKQNNSSGTHLNGIVVWKSTYEGVLDVEMSTIHLFTGSTTHQLAY